MHTEQQLPRAYRHLSLYAGLLIALFALLAAALSQWLAAGVAIILTLLAAAHHALTRNHDLARGRPVVKVATLLMLVLAWGILDGHLPAMLTWLFMLPLMIFMAWRLVPAMVLTAGFALLMGVLTPSSTLGPERLQLLPMLMLTIALTGVFVFLREYKSAQLAPLRRTDALTLASTQDTLKQDLDKEIRRSEREGTALAVLSLALDPPQKHRPALPGADRESMIQQLGRLLHQRLRDFDNYYRLADAGFFVLLPVTTTAGAIQTAQSLRHEAAELMRTQGVALTLSVGVAGLNVGDDVESLQQKALDALNRAQRRGGNQVESFTETGP
ncbi:MAG: diguanylate cyclase [Oleiphilaceae bacterium]|nr:diguanylate cyclase [Oleiphilaceae bacterium]